MLKGVNVRRCKKNDGIFFTPPSYISKNLEILQPYMDNITTILEPSCGSGEYITAILLTQIFICCSTNANLQT